MQTEKKAQTQPRTDGKLEFEQWRINREWRTKNNQRCDLFQKIKLERPKVRITQQQADVLNRGVITHDSNTNFSLYLLPGFKSEFIGDDVVSAFVEDDAA